MGITFLEKTVLDSIVQHSKLPETVNFLFGFFWL